MKHEGSDRAQWFVAHTYSGYENKVKASIEATVENRDMGDQILRVCVPTQEVVEMKDGKRTCREKKMFPGYVVIEMFMTDEAWYVVRNTRGVTGFVGPASEPVPLSQVELDAMGIAAEVPKKQEIIGFKVGDLVEVIEGPLEKCSGIIDAVMAAKSRAMVTLSIFGRETPTEVGFEQIRKIG